MLDGCLAHFCTGASMKNESNCFSCTDPPCRCLRVETVYQGDCEEVRYYSYAMPIAHVYSKPYTAANIIPLQMLAVWFYVALFI